MSRKHFVALAAALKDRRPDTTVHGDALTQWYVDVQAVAAVCRSFNPAFDHERFVTACGVNY